MLKHPSAVECPLFPDIPKEIRKMDLEKLARLFLKTKPDPLRSRDKVKHSWLFVARIEKRVKCCVIAFPRAPKDRFEAWGTYYRALSPAQNAPD